MFLFSRAWCKLCITSVMDTDLRVAASGVGTIEGSGGTSIGKTGETDGEWVNLVFLGDALLLVLLGEGGGDDLGFVALCNSISPVVIFFMKSRQSACSFGQFDLSGDFEVVDLSLVIDLGFIDDFPKVIVLVFVLPLLFN